jgi:hypothetical protein
MESHCCFMRKQTTATFVRYVDASHTRRPHNVHSTVPPPAHSTDTSDTPGTRLAFYVNHPSQEGAEKLHTVVERTSPPRSH